MKLDGFDLLVTSLDAVLAADDDAFPAAAAAALETLAAAQAAAKAAAAATRARAEVSADELEKWRQRSLAAVNRAEALAAREAAGVEAQRDANAAALALMRSLVPSDIATLSLDALVERAASGAPGGTGEGLVSGGGALYPYALAQRLKTKRLLWWCVTHADDIAAANFLVGADSSAFRNLQVVPFLG